MRDVTGSTVSAQDQLDRRLVLAAGASPFHKDKTVPVRPDTSVTLSCTCCSPPLRFVGTAGRTPDEWLARHVVGLTARSAGRQAGKEAANAKRRESYAKQKGSLPE